MRILVQALTAAPAGGGSLTVLRDLVSAWPAQDELQIVCWRGPAAETLEATGHRVVRLKATSSEQALLKMRVSRPRELTRFRPEVVWSQAVWVGGFSVPQAVHYRDIGSFLSIHPDSPRQRVKSMRERADLRRADLRIYNSAALRDAAHFRYQRITHRPHAVIHNGLDLSCFTTVTSRRTSNPGGVVRVLLPQSDTPHKRNWLAAGALARLRESDGAFRDARLTVVGAGDYQDLRSAMADKGLAECLEFAGRVSRSGMAELYGAHDVVLMTGRAESFGNPIVEAHAVGRPIVTAPFAVARELAGPLLYISDADDATSLGKALAVALRSRPDRRAASMWVNGFTAGQAVDRIRRALSGMRRHPERARPAFRRP